MHIPVLQKEVLRYLDPQPNQNFIDGTIGGGGHSAAILERIAPQGKILGIDWDSEILKAAKFKNNLVLACDNFSNLAEIVRKTKFGKADGVLLDLGMSSWHLADSGRGFSFQKKEALDMRYGLENQLTAEKIVNYWSKLELERILREYGEERFAGEIAENIVAARKAKPIIDTFQLVEIIKKSVRGRQKIHPATRTFQALRIAVNDELNNLEKVLPQALQVLRRRGRLVIISFHSLEDRIVKKFLEEKKQENLLEILTRKPISPSPQEIKMNRRARSAKLRAAQKTI